MFLHNLHVSPYSHRGVAHDAPDEPAADPTVVGST